MARPSMFSSDYKKRMKRRRINILLFILILISAAYFGGKYYLDKNNINISLFKNKNNVKNQISEDKKQPEAPVQNQEQPQVSQAVPEEAPKKTEVITYKSSDGNNYEIEVLINGEAREITLLKEETGQVKYDISQDKRFIVFEDRASSDIILGGIDGNFKKISRDSYKSISNGQTYTKAKILSWYPKYIWAQNPKFTSDNRVVYISDLPYLKNDDDLYVWTVNVDGTSHKRIGAYKGSIDSVIYEGIQSDSSLGIKINEIPYKVAPGSFKLVRR